MDPISGKPLAKNELLKADKPDLSGNIRETLANPEADRFTGDDEQFIKFHGIYQQDDRDKRKTGKEYSVMVRTRQTGGIVPAAQYIVYDELSGRFANGTLRITSRQTFQFHGVLQKGIGPLIKSINDALSSTLATCGDVNRNVTAPSNPPVDAIAVQVDEDAFAITRALLPRTTAYHSIWVDGVQVDLGLGDKIAKARASVDQANPYMPPPADTDESGAPSDPLYGKTYLPRKFKTGFAIPPNNDTDIFTNDMGFVAIVENGKLIGYNLLVGGGLGTSHGNKATYPRLADVIGFITREQASKSAPPSSPSTATGVTAPTASTPASSTSSRPRASNGSAPNAASASAPRSRPLSRSSSVARATPSVGSSSSTATGSSASSSRPAASRMPTATS